MLCYEGKVVLAPMVRIGTLPMRLLCLEYGADLVWSPETVDKKIIGAIRTFNPRLGTYDYIKDGSTLVLRTHPREREKFVFQLGSADPELALQAALTIAEDVAGIDLNCGCPKHFSVHAGMGAALLSDPSRLTSILRRLVTGLPQLPITAKIRLLPQKEPTFNLIREILATGIRALTVHCRTPAERPRDVAHFEWLPEIVRMSPVPVIANGDVFTLADIERIKKLSCASSIMIARGAQWNASIFRRSEGMQKDVMLDVKQVSRDYLRHAIQTDNLFSNTKYAILQMWLDRPYSDKHLTRSLQQCRTVQELCQVFNMDYPSESVVAPIGQPPYMIDAQDDN